ncbi:substrate-binding periplasmic protein [Psychromonas antarctica]|uniref:substrate-binding periplasmic protein n=1 Tax=Psychromonas antarctica TaxID=67573 RepID=UPI001EE989E8|nr:transporter substrate-binding domain-containing protein [Psychromonas antarctica]MCG6201685.1 transporter substrate-binding domain-containing protein [Psychromonas antarctica]
MPNFIAFILWLLPASIMAEQLTTANSHWPPWRVLEKDGSLTGIDIDILKGLSRRLELQLVTKGCGWKRCLKYMQVGEGDVMSGLFKTAEREKYMKFIEPPYRRVQNTCFYQKKSQSAEINGYQDLQNITIGVVNKVAYFEPFDSDVSIKKHYAIKDITLFRLLKAQSIDAVIMSCVTGDVQLKLSGLNDEFKHAKYVHRLAHPVYLAVSKQSPLLAREKDVSQALQNMINGGDIKQIMSSYGILEVE